MNILIQALVIVIAYRILFDFLVWNFNFQYLLPRPSGYVRPSQRRDSVCTMAHLRYTYCLYTCRRMHICMCERAHSYICVGEDHVFDRLDMLARPRARTTRYVVVVSPILGLVTLYVTWH